VNHDTIELIAVGLKKSAAARRQGHFATAWKHAHQGMAMSEQSGDSIGIGISFLEFGHIATTEGSPELGLVNYEQATQILGNRAETHEKLHNYLGRSRAFLMLNQPDSAQFYVLAAEEVAQKSITLADRLSLLLQSAKVAAARQEFAVAFKYQKQYESAADTLRKQAAITSLQRERTRQNIVDFQRQKESAEREAQLLAQRNRLYLALGATLVALLLVGILLFLRLRTAREQLAERNENLRQLNATKDRFFGIIAHDLRNPVVALNMAGEQLRFSLGQGAQDTALRQANNINRTVNRLSGLLDNLLQWALLQTGNAPYQPENLHLAALTEEAVDLYEQAAELKQIELTTTIPHHLIIKADPRALLSVIRNLVNNALKFTPSGGKVTLMARSVGREIILEIKDTGIGISPTQQEKLFGSSVTSLPGTAGERGSGLGLLLCQELVVQNGGKIHLVSKEGTGSTFTIHLPAAPQFKANKSDEVAQKVAGPLS
ncbi:MAG: HAMP domain-containing sensor histidine kinase, partial [Bacteroidota bacterium]